jgi:hypothetical protein
MPPASAAACAANVGSISESAGPETVEYQFCSIFSGTLWVTPLVLIHFRRLDLIRRSNSGVLIGAVPPSRMTSAKAPDLLAASRLS